MSNDISLTHAEVQALRAFNEKLCRLEESLLTLEQADHENLSHHSGLGVYQDYEKDAVISYYLREDDPAYMDDDDNILTKRKSSLAHCHTFIADGQDHTAELRELHRLGVSPICWLFHDLYAHSYGSDNPELSLHDMLRIGTIWVDIVKIDQFSIDLV
jgi:hypothetical protein